MHNLSFNADVCSLHSCNVRGFPCLHFFRRVSYSNEQIWPRFDEFQLISKRIDEYWWNFVGITDVGRKTVAFSRWNIITKRTLIGQTYPIISWCTLVQQTAFAIDFVKVDEPAYCALTMHPLCMRRGSGKLAVNLDTWLSKCQVFVWKLIACRFTLFDSTCKQVFDWCQRVVQ